MAQDFKEFLDSEFERMSPEDIQDQQRIASRWSPINQLPKPESVTPVISQTSESFLGRRGQDIARGFENIGAMGGGLAMATGAATGIQGLQNAGEQAYLNFSRSAEANAPRVGTIANVENPGDFAEYLTEGILSNLPQFAITLPSGGVGGIAGNLIARQTAKGIAEDWITKYGAKQAAEMYGKRVALGTELGRYAGGWAPSSAMEAGTIAGNVYDSTQDPEKTGGASLYLGPVAGLFDAGVNFHILKNTLGIPAAKAIVEEGAKRFGVESFKVALEEGSTEAIQNLIENVGTNIQDPNNPVFGPHFLRDTLDNFIQGAAAGGVISLGGESAHRATQPLLKPSTDPQVNQNQKDIEQMADSMVNPDAGLTDQDKLLAEKTSLENSLPNLQEGSPEHTAAKSRLDAISAQLGTTLETQKEPQKQPESTSEQQNDLVSEFEQQKGRPASDQEKNLLGKLTIASNNLNETEDELNRVLLSDQPNQKLQDTLQEQRKQQIEERNTIQSQLEGFEPGSILPTYIPENIGAKTFLQEKGNQRKAEQWMSDHLDVALKRVIGPEYRQGKLFKNLKNSYRQAIGPWAQLFAGLNVQIHPISDFNDKSEKQAPLTTAQITPDNEGNLTFYIPEPSAYAETHGQNVEDYVRNVFPKVAEEEAFHAAYYGGLRQEWSKIAKNKRPDFHAYLDQRSSQLAQDIRYASSNKTINAFTEAYFKNKGRTMSDHQLSSEFIRALLQRMRTGDLTEEVQTAQILAEQGDKPANTFIRAVRNALTTVRNALVNFLNPQTAPKRIKDILDKTNAILDKFTSRNLESYRNPEIPQRIQPNAIQEQSTREVGVRQQQEVGEGVGQENQPEAPAEQSQTQEEKVSSAPSSQAPSYFTEAQKSLDQELTKTFTDALNDAANQAEPKAGDQTGNPRRRASKWFFTDLSPYMDATTRSISNIFNKVNDYVKGKDFYRTLEDAVNGDIKGLEEEEKVVLYTALSKFIPTYRNALEWAPNIPADQKIEQMNELDAYRDILQDRYASIAQSGGRMLRAIQGVKNIFFDGDAAAYDSEKMVFSAAQQAERSLDKASLGEINQAFQSNLFRAAKNIFNGQKMQEFLESKLRQYGKYPDQLKRDIKKSLIKNRKALAEITRDAVSRAGEEIVSPDAEINLGTIYNKILADVQNNFPKQVKQEPEDILKKALLQFAQDHVIKERRSTEKIKNPQLKILRSIIANNSYRQDFIQNLKYQLGNLYPGGITSPIFKANYGEVFDHMKDAQWSEGIRDRALDETLKMMHLNVVRMIQNGWSDDLNKVKQFFRDNMKDVADDGTIDRLVDEIDSAFNQRVSDSLLFKREGQELGTSKSGQLLGGKGLTAFLKQIGKSLTDITKMSYATKSNYISNLASEFVTKLGIPDKFAQEIQDRFIQELKTAVDWQADKNLRNKIENVTQRLSGANKPDSKSVIDKLIEMANQGFLSDMNVYEAIRQNYSNAKLPKWNPLLTQILREKGNELDALPEGELKNEKRQEIANLIANQGGISKVDKMTSYWYFSMLSGPTTWVVNGSYNFFNLMMNGLVWSIQNPQRASGVIKSIGNSFFSKDSSAWKSFAKTMQTGFAAVDMSLKYGQMGTPKFGSNLVEMANLPVERATEETGKIFYRFTRGIPIGKLEFSPRMMFRFLSATDQFFRVAGFQAALSSQGLEATSDQIAQATNRADQEANLGLFQKGDAKYATRVQELINEQLKAQNPTAYLIAQQRGLETAFTQKPKGAVGYLAQMLGSAANKYPFPFRLMFPFTNIVANVWNETLNYTPLGAARWYLSTKTEMGRQWGFEDQEGNPIRDDSLLIKAVLGTLAAAVITGIEGDDDDKDWFVIYGNGPSNPSDRQAWYDRGFRPYTMKVGDAILSYQYMGPLSAVLGTLGSLADLKRNEKGKNQDAITTGSAMAAALLTSQFSQSFLSSFSSFMDALSSPDPGKSLQKFLAFQASSVAPNLLKQTGRWMDPQLYTSDNFWGMVVKDIPVAKRMGPTEPALNVFGDFVYRREIPVLGKLVSLKGGDPALNELYNLGLSIPTYRFELNGAPMSERQKYEYVKTAGPQLKAAIERLMPTFERLVDNGQIDKAQDLLNDSREKILRATRKTLSLEASQNNP